MAERLIPGDPGWIPSGWEHLQRYQHALGYCKGLRVLDVGCGTGYGSFVLANNSAAEVVGVDRSSETVGTARAKYPRANLTYQEGDAEALSPALGSFDVGISFENIEHLPHPLKFIASVADSLKEGGLLIVSAPNTLKFQKAAAPQDNEFHLSEPTYQELRDWVETRFTVEQEWEQSRMDYGIQQWKVTLSTVYRLERKIRSLLGLWAHKWGPASLQWRTTEIFPLLPERRAVCQHFLFVCRKKPAGG